MASCASGHRAYKAGRQFSLQAAELKPRTPRKYAVHSASNDPACLYPFLFVCKSTIYSHQFTQFCTCCLTKQVMDEIPQIVKLCLPRLTPKDMCMLRCSCSELRGMGVSWQDHSINFSLGWSGSATFWLLKNIVSMRELNLNISGDVSQTALQDVMEAGR